MIPGDFVKISCQFVLEQAWNMGLAYRPRYAVLNEASAVVPLEEAEKERFMGWGKRLEVNFANRKHWKHLQMTSAVEAFCAQEGVAVTVDDLDIIARENHLGGIEGAEEGVSYGVGAPWTDAIIPYCFRVGSLEIGPEIRKILWSFSNGLKIKLQKLLDWIVISMILERNAGSLHVVKSDGHALCLLDSNVLFIHGTVDIHQRFILMGWS